MKMFNSILHKLFIPLLVKNEFTKERYIKDLQAGKFRDKFNLGVLDDNGIGLWNVKNFVEEPNGMFIGAMGSGKSKACLFTTATWFAANNDQTVLFIVDTAKSAQDYEPLFSFDNVHTVLQDPEGVHKVIDMLYDEAQERSKKFAEVGGAPNLNIYEDKTGENMTRYLVVMEEFHEIPRILDFDKMNKIEGSSAAKFFFLMRTGRSLGIWFLICSQKSTKSDIPSEVVQNFTQKQIFKVSKAEAEYVLSRQEPALLNSEQKGRCFNDKGEIQFPYVDEASVRNLLKRFAVKPFTSKSALLSSQIIKDILSGKSSRDRYQHKKIAALAKNFETMPSQLVITMFHEAMGCKVEEKNASIDENQISHVVTYPSGEKVAVMIKITKKMSSKHVQQLIKGIKSHQCHRGILYTTAETPSTSLYKFAVEHDIELVDKEDLIQQAQIIDYNLEQGIHVVYKADSIASKDKEGGSYQKNNNIKDKSLAEIIEEDDDEGLAFVDEEIDPKAIDNVIDKELEKVREMENQTDEDSLDDIIPPSVAPTKSPVPDFVDPFMKEDILKNLKKVKQDTCDISFKLNPEDNPSFMIHCLRNESNEVYCALFYVLVQNKVKNKYYIFRKVEGQFDYVARRKFDLKSAEEWNEKPLVLDDEAFQKTIDRYVENFAPCENPVYIICWEKDLEFVKERIMKDSVGFTDSPYVLESYFKEIGLEQSRDDLIKSLRLKVDNSLFEELEFDYQLWSTTL